MRYVALLRAVNVGGRTVKMDRLRVLFEELKLRNVETFIASGNVIFETTAGATILETKIEKHLEKSLGFAVPTMVRSVADFAAVATHTPFASHPPLTEQGALYVGFLKSLPLGDGLAKSAPSATPAACSHYTGASSIGALKIGGRFWKFRSRSSNARSAVRRPSATSRRYRRSPSAIAASSPVGARPVVGRGLPPAPRSSPRSRSACTRQSG